MNRNTKFSPDHVLNLDHQWKLFCERAGLDNNKMPPDQIREMRRAFYGGLGQMLYLLRDDVSIYPENVAVEIYKNFSNQILNFWNKEKDQQN